ncbi:hypothetical protein AKJ09_08022 [Labilithrix luteola]|uniref:Lipoprotein n=1 Tax=Labilithrix luteola TaxID=1391654 RepID=A0A0K1Q6L9_9BACT|nr:hypothetical protein [Labilithrix luteola]AKV01359.1 hypothetical protein AKJ09_08022 [Labilithrix luteola]
MNVRRLLGLAATLTACGQRANPGVVTASEFRLVDGGDPLT